MILKPNIVYTKAAIIMTFFARGIPKKAGNGFLLAEKRGLDT